LTADQFTRIDEVSRPPLQYPYWHQANSASDRLSAADLSLLGVHIGKG
ncbi:MAG: aldo/keto reductase, partial [Actinomycetota bacterium]